MEQGHKLKLHTCKFCNKSFPCGRSLGGHMRSHVITNFAGTDESPKTRKNPIKEVGLGSLSHSGYGLRENPKRSSRFGDSGNGGFSIHGKFCKDCGKGFKSWKALLGHMKSHSEKESCVSEIELEPEEVAMCLMMLSRDCSSMSMDDSSDKALENCASGSLKIGGEGLKKPKLDDDECKIEVSDKGKNLVFPKKSDSRKRKLHHDSTHSGQSEIEFQSESFSASQKRRSKFECTTCNKVFHSYQALGGHRASHQKLKGCFNSKIESSESSFDNEASPDSVVVTSGDALNRCSEKESRGHECPICFKVFASGQALGGHKRSHPMGGSEVKTGQAIVIQKPVIEIRKLLDLNLPAPAEDEGNVEDESDEPDKNGFKPRWVESSSHKLVGLTST